MRLADLSVAELRARLAGPGLALDFGGARARIHADVPGLAEALRAVYHAFPLDDPAGFFEVSVKLRRGRGLRRWVRPQAVFVADGAPLFEPFPADTHLPLLEWGLNYLLAERINDRLLLHAGVVEKGGRAIVLPAMPGSGKSTLTAALNACGYRLLSDEFGVFDLADGSAWPLLRPIALKNESIALMRRFAPHATIGPTFGATRKGDVAHLAPDEASVQARHACAHPVLVVFPQYDPAVDLELEVVPAARAFARLAVNSFNYELLGRAAFDTVGALVSRARCYRLVYRDLDRAIAEIGRLHAAHGEAAGVPGEGAARTLTRVVS